MDCQHMLAGCKRAACRDRHPCRPFSYGTCEDGVKCGSLHLTNAVGTPLCGHAAVGRCKFGAGCRYPHFCHYFAKGVCKFGSKCVNVHFKPRVRAAGPPPPPPPALPMSKPGSHIRMPSALKVRAQAAQRQRAAPGAGAAAAKARNQRIVVAPPVLKGPGMLGLAQRLPQPPRTMKPQPPAAPMPARLRHPMSLRAAPRPFVPTPVQPVPKAAAGAGAGGAAAAAAPAAGAGGPPPKPVAVAPPAVPAPTTPVAPPPGGDVPALEAGLDGDDLCNACFTDPLKEAPAIKLPCGHGVHTHCMRQLLAVNTKTPRLSFAFLTCPLKCKAPLAHPQLDDLLKPLHALKQQVTEKAVARLKFEELEAEAAAAAAAGEDVEAFAMRTLTYYKCFKCESPYFGGRAACGAGGGPEPRPEELLCPLCAPYSPESSCEKHGTAHIVWKCRFCCSQAL